MPTSLGFTERIMSCGLLSKEVEKRTKKKHALDIPLKHRRIHKTQLERSNCHRRRDRTKIKHVLILQDPQMIQRITRMPQRIQHHPTLRPRRLFQSRRVIKVLHLFKPTLLPKNLSGPKIPLLVDVFTKVADDVGRGPWSLTAGVGSLARGLPFLRLRRCGRGLHRRGRQRSGSRGGIRRWWRRKWSGWGLLCRRSLPCRFPFLGRCR